MREGDMVILKVKQAFIYGFKNNIRQLKRQYELPGVFMNLIVEAIIEPLIIAVIAFPLITEQFGFYFLTLAMPFALFFNHLDYICKNIKKANNWDTLRLLGLTKFEAALSCNLLYNFSGFLAVLIDVLSIFIKGVEISTIIGYNKHIRRWCCFMQK